MSFLALFHVLCTRFFSPAIFPAVAPTSTTTDDLPAKIGSCRNNTIFLAEEQPLQIECDARSTAFQFIEWPGIDRRLNDKSHIQSNDQLKGSDGNDLLRTCNKCLGDFDDPSDTHEPQ